MAPAQLSLPGAAARKAVLPMHDHPSLSDLKADKARREHDVLTLLLESTSDWPWSVAEVSRVVGDDVLAFDAIVGLHAAGLVHRSREFVFPTRAAARLHELAARSAERG